VPAGEESACHDWSASAIRSMAALLLLERLSPLERAVFV
jgi:hypothetical protein